jgi:hypothetical protein
VKRGCDLLILLFGTKLPFYSRFVDFPAMFCCHKIVYITYRGSSYEKSWETHFRATAACFLRGDSRWLCQSSATTTPCSAAATGAHLPDQ